jgi:hypothetical protein
MYILVLVKRYNTYIYEMVIVVDETYSKTYIDKHFCDM